MIERLVENQDVQEMALGEQEIYYHLTVPQIEAQLVLLGLQPRLRPADAGFLESKRQMVERVFLRQQELRGMVPNELEFDLPDLDQLSDQDSNDSDWSIESDDE